MQIVYRNVKNHALNDLFHPKDSDAQHIKDFNCHACDVSKNLICIKAGA